MDSRLGSLAGNLKTQLTNIFADYVERVRSLSAASVEEAGSTILGYASAAKREARSVVQDYEQQLLLEITLYAATFGNTAELPTEFASIQQWLHFDAQVDATVRPFLSKLGEKASIEAPLTLAMAWDLISWKKISYSFEMLSNMMASEVLSSYMRQVAVGSKGSWKLVIVEVIDARNHPFSRAAHMVKATPKGLFKVPVGDVRKAAAGMGLKATGILWPVKDGHYVGRSLPAHYNDRGIIVAAPQSILVGE